MFFEAEEFISSDFHQKMLHYEKIFRDDITEAIEKDESNKPEDVDEMIDDVEHLRNKFDKDGNVCFKYCSKRKINSISDMADVLLDNEFGDDLKKSNPRKFNYIKELLKPYRKSIGSFVIQVLTYMRKGKSWRIQIWRKGFWTL